MNITGLVTLRRYLKPRRELQKGPLLSSVNAGWALITVAAS